MTDDEHEVGLGSPWIMGSFMIAWVLMGLIWILDLPGENDKTCYISPCQCKMTNCPITVKRKFTGLYSDGTDPDDYDIWGRYVGSMDVPEECQYVSDAK